MSTDIDQRTAALLVFVEENAPCRNSSATKGGSLGVIDLTEGAVQSLLLEVLGTGGLAGLIADGQLLAAALLSIQHLSGLGGVDGHGLLAHDVLARVQRVYGDEAVGTVGGADVNYLNGLVSQKILVVFVDLSVGSAVLGLGGLSTFYDDVTEGHHFHVGKLFQRGHMLTVGDTAAADDTDLYDSFFCHVSVLLFLEHNATAMRLLPTFYSISGGFSMGLCGFFEVCRVAQNGDGGFGRNGG